MSHPWFVRKSIASFTAVGESGSESDHKRVLGLWSLTALGIGCTIGAGIFVMPGLVAAKHAGPAVVLSFVLAAIACLLAALCYSELAVMMPASGSAYSYAYAAFGQLVAFLMGWDLLLEYGLSNSAVAAGWGGYLQALLAQFGVTLPKTLLYAPGQLIPGSSARGWFNLPAGAAVAFVTVLLLFGIRESARFNNAMVTAKIAVLGLFLILCVPGMQFAHFNPFMPFGWGGVVSGAAVVFFLFIGFDAVSTVAEETRDVQRTLPRAIALSLTLVTLLYVAVATVLVAVLPMNELRHVQEPLAFALEQMRHPVAALVLSMVAVVGILSVILVASIGQTRILYVMSRDGLMPAAFTRLHPTTGAPYAAVLILGGVTAFLAMVVPLEQLADLVSMGTLAAFSVVSAAVLVLRHEFPEAPRPFRCPGAPFVPGLAIAINLYLMWGLSWTVWSMFLVWIAIGFGVYVRWLRPPAVT